MKKIFATLTTAIIFLSFLTACNMENTEQNSPEKVTLEGELLNTKGGPSIDGVYLPENEYDEYIGKTIKVMGEVTTLPADELVNEKGEYSQGWADGRKIMQEVESIEVIE